MPATMESLMALVHEGKKRRSGRYPWGSGERPFQSEPHLRKSTSPPKTKGQIEIDSRKKLRQKIREISADELREKIDRLQNEKKLKDLIDADISPGKKMLTEILISVGKDTATQVLKGSVKYVIDKGLRDEKFDPKALAEAIYPRKGDKKKDDK